MHIQRVMERAENVTRVPQANSEFVQAGTGARAGLRVGLRVGLTVRSRASVRRQATSESYRCGMHMHVHTPWQ